MFFVDDVKKDSLAFYAGIKKGDIITHINHEKVTDGLCYGYLLCQEKVTLTITSNNKEKNISINNDYEDIGVVSNRPLIENPKSCHNKCMFCFIDQLPIGLREGLYFKDDDARLSFLTGNYVTLTNLKDSEIDNIIKMRLSPINISVHTTNDALRIKMLNNKNAGNIKNKIKKFVDNMIMVNAQIVLCKDYNDGAELENTIKDLYALNVNSLSIVPIGLTKFRENLTQIEPFSKKDCINIIKTIEKFSKLCYNDIRTRFVYPADEFFVKAEIPIPSYSYYEEFPQIENGVGLLASFIREFTNSLKNRRLTKITKKTVITSYCAYPTMRFLIDKFNQKFHADIELIKIKNNFFGEQVTVAGLLTATDIIEQLNGKNINELLVPSVILRSEQDLTLDNKTIKDIEIALKCSIKLIEPNGKKLVDTLINREK